MPRPPGLRPGRYSRVVVRSIWSGEVTKRGNVIRIDRRPIERRDGSRSDAADFYPDVRRYSEGGDRRRRGSHVRRNRVWYWFLLFILPIIAGLGLWWRSSYINRPHAVISVGPIDSTEMLLPDITVSRYSHIVYETAKNPDLAQIVSGLGFDESLAGDMLSALNRLRPPVEKSAPAEAQSGAPAEAKIGDSGGDNANSPAAAAGGPLPLIHSGQTLRFALGKSKYPSLVFAGEQDRAGHPTEISLRANKAGKYRATVAVVPTIRRERIGVGVIRTSFSAAAKREGVPQDVMDEFVDLFSDRVVFHKDFRPGDRFTVIYREGVNRRGNRGKETGSILAAALEVNNRQLIAAGYVGTDGKRRFFDQNGQLLGNAFLRYPLTFSRISSYFTRSRFHPVLKISRPHNGVDFAAPIGTPVRSVADGVVEFAGTAGGSGNMVKIAHGPRYSTAYLHLSRIDRSVRKGARISRGQVIGGVGMSGLATGPHLHYSFYDNGKYTDPLKISLPTLDSLSSGSKIDRNYLKRVLFTLNHYQTVKLNDFYRD